MFVIHQKLAGAGVLLALLTLPAGGGSAQQGGGGEPPRFSMTVQLGLTLSTVRFQDPNANDQTRIRSGFHIGAGAVRAIGRYAEVEGLVLYSQGGFWGRGGHPASLRVGFLGLPVAFRARPPWRVSPHLVVGIAPRLRLHCGLADVGMVGEAGCGDPVVGSRWKRFDLVGLGGLGLSIGMGERRVAMEGTIQWGLRDLKSGLLPPGWAKSADLRFSTAFQFPLGGER